VDNVSILSILFLFTNVTMEAEFTVKHELTDTKLRLKLSKTRLL